MKIAKKNIVWISAYAPYDKVDHAGGKNHNYYLKYIHSKDCFDIKLLSVCKENEKEKLDLSSYQIEHEILANIRTGIKGYLNRLQNVNSTLNPFCTGGGLLSNVRKRLLQTLIRRNSQEMATADVIILQWTESLLLLPFVKKYCKADVHIIAIEEDVAFLGFQRKYEIERNVFVKCYKKIKYRSLKKAELAYLRQCDTICCLNEKDKKLLLDNGISEQKLLVTVPYFDNYSDVKSDNTGFDIMFYGQMKRIENQSAVDWFIDKVMPLLPESYRFVIVGGRPPKELRERANERIVVTGFVQDIRPYLENSLCMAVPLLLGAGIKIKILEGLSAGKIILTNEIGAEGIPMRNGEDYLKCVAPQEYADTIMRLNKKPEEAQTISNNAKQVIQKYFNVDAGLDTLISKIEECDNKQKKDETTNVRKSEKDSTQSENV